MKINFGKLLYNYIKMKSFIILIFASIVGEALFATYNCRAIFSKELIFHNKWPSTFFTFTIETGLERFAPQRRSVKVNDLIKLEVRDVEKLYVVDEMNNNTTLFPENLQARTTMFVREVLKDGKLSKVKVIGVKGTSLLTNYSTVPTLFLFFVG